MEISRAIGDCHAKPHPLGDFYILVPRSAALSKLPITGTKVLICKRAQVRGHTYPADTLHT